MHFWVQDYSAKSGPYSETLLSASVSFTSALLALSFEGVGAVTVFSFNSQKPRKPLWYDWMG